MFKTLLVTSMSTTDKETDDRTDDDQKHDAIWSAKQIVNHLG